MALNHNREKRYQEALLSACFTLESLAYHYVEAVKLPRNTIKKSKGMARWVETLYPPVSKHVCQSLSEMWTLRNDVVHRRKIITRAEIQTIKDGIKALAILREYFLTSIDSGLLKLENQFDSFLEPIQMGVAISDSIKEMVQMKYGWRRECDNYHTLIRPRLDE